MKRIPLSRGVALLPNLFTTGSLFCGFYAMVRAISGDFFDAALAIGFCSLFDMLDGRIARMTKSESDFGVEYDSLVDLSSFGIAPGILIYVWSLADFQRIGWLAVFLYVACAALRLARFNVQLQSVEKKRFQGLPTPAAALLLASLVLLYESGYGPDGFKGSLSVGLTFLLGPLMVSQIRYRSFKDLDLKSPNAFYFLVAAVGLILVLALHPEFMPFIVFSTYVLSGPAEEILFLRKKAGEAVSAKLRRKHWPKANLVSLEGKRRESYHEGSGKDL
ncbi:MAG: CDP-diacylglycerol--serine O-phosphatidyltransferase [Deltaproteobacteria bacterium]|nr:CDP-diacylglycerol--serine O-phosphatidyltransferase [Deltaproteobacteria bacterium]